MKRVPMDPFVRSGLRIPGGWEARVPEYSVDDETLKAYTQYLMQDGLSTQAAEAEAKNRLQRIAERGYIRHLKEAIARYARDYADIHPERLERSDDGALYEPRGFEPEIAQRLWIPYDNSGRAGKPWARKILREMGGSDV